MNNKEMELIFTQGTPHIYLSVIFISQNMYHGGRHARTIALNTWYMVLIKTIFIAFSNIMACLIGNYKWQYELFF